MSDELERRRLAVELGRVLATEEGRSNLTVSYTSGREILIALEADTIGSVIARATQHVPPIVVAAWLPGRADCPQSFGFITIEPSRLGGDNQDENGPFGPSYVASSVTNYVAHRVYT